MPNSIVATVKPEINLKKKQKQTMNRASKKIWTFQKKKKVKNKTELKPNSLDFCI